MNSEGGSSDSRMRVSVTLDRKENLGNKLNKKVMDTIMSR